MEGQVTHSPPRLRRPSTREAAPPGGQARPATAEAAHRTRNWLILGSVGLLVARVLMTLPRPGPVVIIDEIGYLTNARVLADGVAGQMGTAPFYRGGYSLLLTPIVAVFHDPHTAYRVVLVLNAVLAASVFPLLYLLLTRGFGASPRHALWAALAGALYPAVTLMSHAAVSENLLVPLTVGWLLSTAWLLRARARGALLAAAATAGLCAAGLYAVHGRMLVAVAVTGLALVALAARRRVPIAASAAGLVTLAVGCQAARMLQDHIIERNYGGRTVDEAGGHLSALGSADGALTMAGNLIGHSWYLAVATLGLTVVLVAGAGPGAARALARGSAGVSDQLLAVLLLTSGGLVLVSAVWFSDITRSEMLVYGRYAEVVAPPLVAVGLVMLADARAPVRPLTVAAGILTATVAVALLRTGLDVPGGDGGLLIDGTLGRIRQLSSLSLAEAAVVAAAGTALLAVLVPRLRRRRVVVALVALTGVAVGLRAALEVPEGGNRWNAVSIPFATDNFVPWGLGAAGLVAAAAAAGLILLAGRRPGAVAVVGLLALLPTTAYAYRYHLNHSRSVYPDAWTSPDAALPERGVGVVAYDLDRYDLIGEGVYQWFLPDTPVVLFHGDAHPPPSGYVISSGAWGREHPELRAVRLWSDPGRDQALWRIDRPSGAAAG